jgi:hypothetical protein
MNTTIEQYQVIHAYNDNCDSTNWRWLDCDDCVDVHETCQMRVCVDCGSDVDVYGETR